MNKLELKKQQLINSLVVSSSQLDIVFELLKLEREITLQEVK